MSCPFEWLHIDSQATSCTRLNGLQRLATVDKADHHVSLSASSCEYLMSLLLHWWILLFHYIILAWCLLEFLLLWILCSLHWSIQISTLRSNHYLAIYLQAQNARLLFAHSQTKLTSYPQSWSQSFVFSSLYVNWAYFSFSRILTLLLSPLDHFSIVTFLVKWKNDVVCSKNWINQFSSSSLAILMT